MASRLSLLIVGSLLIFGAITLYCSTSKDSENDNNASATSTLEVPEPTEEQCTIQGVVRMVGNEPFTMLVITTTENVSYILEEKKNFNQPMEYTDLQGRTVRAEGICRTVHVPLADHSKYITHRYIEPVKLDLVLYE